MSTLKDILSQMSGQTVTLGWDVVVAYDATSVNELFAQQFVANVRATQNLSPITDSITISNVTVQLRDVVLGPPLITFTEAVGTQEAVVEMNFISGELVILSQAGGDQFVTGYQSIVPGDQYALQMTVDLEQVTGQVTASKAVVVDLQNAKNYKANLIGDSAAVYLGQYFQTLFQKETPGSFTYQLGALTFGASENLSPTSFDIRTQPRTGAGGAVLLFVATTYNPNGGNLPGNNFPYLIPDGYGAAVVIASATLFGRIMPSYYTDTMSGDSPTFETGSLSGTSPASCLRFTGGGTTVDGIEVSWLHGLESHDVWTGSKGDQNNPQQVTVPFEGLTIEPSDNLLAVSWDATWRQPFGEAVATTKTPKTLSSEHLTMRIKGSFSATPTVDRNTDVVSFTGTGDPKVSFAKSSKVSKLFGDGDARDKAGSKITGAVKPSVDAILNLQLPQVDAFAVSHLLFPSSNVMQFSNVYVPGDLVLFGQIAPQQTAFVATPLQAVIGAGETQQFIVSPNVAVTWSINPRVGSISSSGLYTAPSSLASAVPIVVTATDAKEDVTTAILTVVPHAISVSPAFAMIFPNAGPTTFVAAVLGNLGAPAWSISPNDGSSGTISSTGVYTPPATFTGVAGATITATAGGESASAVVALIADALGINVTPNFVTLGPGGTQQFAIPGNEVPAWSVIPAGAGAIASDGTYTAPSSIPQNMTAFVVATASAFGNTYAGGAVIALTPQAPS